MNFVTLTGIEDKMQSVLNCRSCKSREYQGIHRIIPIIMNDFRPV